MSGGRIAVVITCRDLGRTLVEALQSVERQTRVAAEIVIVDDRSADLYTRQVVARLERNGTCVVIGEGRGASAARNLGARLTTADYLVWLDADDVLEPGYFEAAAARLEGDAALDFVSCAMRAFGAADYVWSPSRPAFVDAVSTGGVPHASTMVRRRLWETVGGFDENVPSFELLDFWASAIERGFQGVILEEPLLNYRVRNGSGYRRSIQPETYLARMRQFYVKHRAAIERHGPELIVAKEAFRLSQREYHATLAARAASIEAELQQLQAEIADVARQLESHGASRVEWADLRRTQPLSQQWGRDRGTSIDRYYIERFLGEHHSDIRGRVLEVRDATYTRQFGGDTVTQSDVIDDDPGNGFATVVADLSRVDTIPTSTYDCIILTQTLQFIGDVQAAIAECARILRPGGVLLATAPCVIRVDDEGGPDGDYWRLTEAAARKLFAAAFPIDAFDVAPYGNVMACSAFLYGLSVEELSPADLDRQDAAFPLVITIRAVKPPASARRDAISGEASPKLEERRRGAILAYHRVAELSPDSHHLCMPPEVFRDQMTFVRDHLTPMGLEDLVRAAARGRIPEGAVAITLDDGYLDALTNASPILTDLGIPATFFINTDQFGDVHERWWDILERVFLSAQALPSTLELRAGSTEVSLPTNTPQQRADALARVHQAGWPLDADARRQIVRDVLAWRGLDEAPRATHRVLTADEVRALASRPGHSIGAHTTHHLALTHHPADRKRAEIVENKAVLEQLLGRPVPIFAYPYGEYDAETIAIVSEAGFVGAVTVEPGMVSAGANRLLLPRYEITAGDPRAFPARMRQLFELTAV